MNATAPSQTRGPPGRPGPVMAIGGFNGTEVDGVTLYDLTQPNG